MSYKLKTLIVFDTNSLRSTEAGEIAYSFFAFGRPFQVIEEFLIEKNLTDDIHIAIPTWTLEELKDQKQRQYITDLEEFKRISKRLSGLPHIPEIVLNEVEFSSVDYIEEKAKEYLETKQIKLLEIEEAKANTVLQSMMKRVMKDQNKKQPFAHSGKYKDAGFKDNIVWESLMHFDGVVDYNKVIFLTKDGDYKNCEIEFRDKWERHITIWQDENNVLADINKDYGNYIAERTIYDFAQTEYFTDYLEDILKAKTSIIIEDKEHKIENFSVTNICKKVDRMPPNEDDVENIIINSELFIFYSESGNKKQQFVRTKTTLWDDDSKEIESTEFEFELI